MSDKTKVINFLIGIFVYILRNGSHSWYRWC